MNRALLALIVAAVLVAGLWMWGIGRTPEIDAPPSFPISLSGSFDVDFAALKNRWQALQLDPDGLAFEPARANAVKSAEWKKAGDDFASMRNTLSHPAGKFLSGIYATTAYWMLARSELVHYQAQLDAVSYDGICNRPSVLVETEKWMNEKASRAFDLDEQLTIFSDGYPLESQAAGIYQAHADWQTEQSLVRQFSQGKAAILETCAEETA